MKMYLIMWCLSPHPFLFYTSNFKSDKISVQIASNLNLLPISIFDKLNISEYFLVIIILILGIILVLVRITFKNKSNNLGMKIGESAIKSPLENSEKRGDCSEYGSKMMILEETEQRILERLDDFEKSNQFNQREISLYNLSHEINTNTKYLSTIIKKHKHKPFNNYINELRIQYIVQKLRYEPHYLSYKISHLAEEVGFSSHSAFSSVFYQIMGVKPSVFIKNLKAEMNNNASDL